MKQTTDVWFIRFPDGRVLRAANTLVIRQQLGMGRIPPGSTVRRSPEEEWVALEWTQEFSDLVQKRSGDETREAGREKALAPTSREQVSVAARMDPTRLLTVGVPGLGQELLAALDSTLVRKKLLVAVLAGMLFGAVVALFRFTDVGDRLLAIPRTERVIYYAWVLATVFLLFVFTAASALLTRLTYVELCNLRPAGWGDGLRGLTGLTVRLALALVLVGGVTLLLIGGLRLLPERLANSEAAWVTEWRSTLAGPTVTVCLLLEYILWPVLVLALLLGPVLAVEECSALSGIWQWLRLLRENFGRVCVYEMLGAGLGVVALLPFIIPLLLAHVGLEKPEQFAFQSDFARTVMAAVVLAPLGAYLTVANVFIYLNLRYETPVQR